MAEGARFGSWLGVVPSGEIDGVAEEADGLTGAPEAAGIGDVIDMERFFRPRAIAIIGASVKPDTISGRPIQFLKKQRYQDAVYPVNPKYEEVAGYRCYPDIESVPGPVDVAIIAVAAHRVPSVIAACARKGVAFAVILSAGFAEVGGDGVSLQAEIRRIARTTGPRIVGPNTIGSLNVAEPVPMGFAFPLGFDEFVVGSIGFAGQSGAFTYSAFSVAQQLGLGFHYVANTGNEADLDSIDFLRWMVEQDEVTTLAAYLEGLRDSRHFLQLARRAAQLAKPVIVLKAGRSPVGREAVASHTAALTGSAESFDAAARQLGFIQVSDIDELMDALMIFSRRRQLPKGRRAAIISTSGASGVLMADHFAARGIEVPPLPEAIRQAVAEVMPAFGSPQNPVDVTATIMDDPGLLKRVLVLLRDCPDFDMIVAMFSTLTGEVARRVAADVADVVKDSHKPIVMNILGSDELAAAGLAVLRRSDVPYFRGPSRVARALGWLADYAEFVRSFHGEEPGWVTRLEEELGSAAASPSSRPSAPSRPLPSRSLPAGPFTSRGPATSRAVPPLGSQQAGEGKALWEGEALWAGLVPLEMKGPSEGLSKSFLARWGFPVPSGGTATDVEEALRLAESVGYPVAVKIDSPDIWHKTEAGGVRLGVDGPDALRDAFAHVMAGARAYNSQARLLGVRVEAMARPGVEVICGARWDPTFGPLVVFGTGGVLVELFQDVAIRMAPLTLRDARAMMGEVKGAALLRGFRGRPAADEEAVARLLVRLSQLMAEARGRIAEIDLNPVIVYEAGKGLVCADALVIPASCRRGGEGAGAPV